MRISGSERHDNVEHLLTIAGLLHVGDLAAAAIGDPGLGNLVIADRIVGGDVLLANDAGNLQIAHLEIDARFLPAVDDHITVGQDLGHDGGDAEINGLVALHRTDTLIGGDRIEFDLLQLLAATYLDRGDYWNGLSTMRETVALFAEAENTTPISERMVQVFRRLFVDGEAAKLPPLKALSLYEEFRELSPIDEAGDVVLRSLAARLVSLDLLAKAADLLDHQVRFRLTGVPQAEVGGDLALVRLLDGRPEAALEALNATARGLELPVELARKRGLLEAQALRDLGEIDEAFARVADWSGREADTLRGELLWRRQDWAGAAEVFGRLAPGDSQSLTGDAGRLVLKQAVALALATDWPALDRLRQDRGELMAKTPLAAAFKVVIAGQSKGALNLEAVGKSLTEADEFRNYLRAYRGALERRAEARPAQPSS